MYTITLNEKFHYFKWKFRLCKRLYATEKKILYKLKENEETPEALTKAEKLKKGLFDLLHEIVLIRFQALVRQKEREQILSKSLQIGLIAVMIVTMLAGKIA